MRNMNNIEKIKLITSEEAKAWDNRGWQICYMRLSDGTIEAFTSRLQYEVAVCGASYNNILVRNFNGDIIALCK